MIVGVRPRCCRLHQSARWLSPWTLPSRQQRAQPHRRWLIDVIAGDRGPPVVCVDGAYELLTARSAQLCLGTRGRRPPQFRAPAPAAAKPPPASAAELRLVRPLELGQGNRNLAGVDLQRRAWQWSLAHRASDGSLPSGSAIAAAHGRQERWGRLVKEAGQAGTLGPTAMSQPTAPHGALGQTTATGAASAQ